MTDDAHTQSLQDRFAPASICYGCGPANQAGLQIKSFPAGDELLTEWQAEAKYQAFPGVLYGGLIGSLLDCHMNWTAAWHLMQKQALDAPPCTVTATYTVKFLRPTAFDRPVRLVARVSATPKDDRAEVRAELYSGDELCATGEGLFVAVKPGHPAYHRW